MVFHWTAGDSQAAVAAVVAGGGFLALIYRRGRSEGGYTSALNANTKATENLTRVTGDLALKLEGHVARTDERLDGHQSRLDEHGQRLELHDQRLAKGGL